MHDVLSISRTARALHCFADSSAYSSRGEPFARGGVSVATRSGRTWLTALRSTTPTRFTASPVPPLRGALIPARAF